MHEVLQFPSKVQEINSIDYLPIAVGAGLVVATKTVELALCPEVSNDPTEYAPRYLAFNANASLWLRTAGLEARRKGEELLATRRQQVFAGNFSGIPLDVDAVGTAEKVAKIGKIYGRGSPEHKEARGGLFKDYARKWAEAFRNNTWENFEETVQDYVPEADELYADGLPVGDMIHSGITPVAEAEEGDLRINDTVTYEITKTIIQTPNLPPTVMLNLKPCPNYAHISLKNNPKSAHGGYSPAIDKLMVNLDVFDPKAKKVVHYQLGVSGKEITPEVMQEFLFDLKIVKTMEPMSRTEIHGTLGILQGEGLPTIDIIASLLDKKASEKSGKNIFLGEVVPEDHPKDYSIIFTEPEKRRHQQVGLTNQLVEYVEELEAKKVDHAVATQMVEKFIQDTLLGIVEKNPDQAEIIFDKATAERFRVAQELQKEGRHSEAEAMREEARLKAPAAGSCGAGSCGLEALTSISKELLEKLHAEPGDTIVADAERPCNKCGEKKVVYAYNATKVNTYCRGCEAFESTEMSPSQ